MSHRKSASRRFAGRLVLFSLVGWALFSRGQDDEFEIDPDDRRSRAGDLFDFDELSVSWDGLETGSRPANEAETVTPGAEGPAVRPKRRLATSLVFVTLFFAGAAFSAGAGDVIADAVDSGTVATEDVTSTEETGTTTTTADENGLPADDGGPVDDPGDDPSGEPGGDGTSTDDGSGDDQGSEPPADDGTTGDGTGEDGSDPGDTGEPGGGTDDQGEPGDVGGNGEPGDPDDQGQPEDPASDPANTDGDGSSSGEPGSSSEDTDSTGAPGGSDTPPGPPLLDPPDGGVTESGPPDPEVDELGGAATIWLHRTLPDPTPPARRLRPAFAHMLTREAARAHADWALVLGVIRARGHNGGQPAAAREVRSLAVKLHRLSRAGEWSAVLALYGRTAFADRAVALARYNRAVGLNALVIGLQAAKPALQRAVLGDPRLRIYPAGRSDVATGRIDVRVLVVMRYLAEAHGSVTVSSLHSGHRLFARPGVVSAHVYGLAVDVSALGGVPIAGNQQVGSVTERAVRSVLLLPAELQPRQVISLLGLGGPSFPLADHADHIHIGF